MAKKRGRPSKFDGIDLRQVQVAGQLGLTDVQICSLLDVSEPTLNSYKKKHPEFLKSLKKGKEYADENVVVSLYKRACGYSHPDVHISNFQGAVTRTNIIKHYPPDTTAMIFWLQNRQPVVWRDKRNQFQDNEEDELKFEGWE